MVVPVMMWQLCQITNMTTMWIQDQVQADRRLRKKMLKLPVIVVVTILLALAAIWKLAKVFVQTIQKSLTFALLNVKNVAQNQNLWKTIPMLNINALEETWILALMCVPDSIKWP